MGPSLLLPRRLRNPCWRRLVLKQKIGIQKIRRSVCCWNPNAWLCRFGELAYVVAKRKPRETFEGLPWGYFAVFRLCMRCIQVMPTPDRSYVMRYNRDYACGYVLGYA